MVHTRAKVARDAQILFMAEFILSSHNVSQDVTFCGKNYIFLLKKWPLQRRGEGAADVMPLKSSRILLLRPLFDLIREPGRGKMDTVSANNNILSVVPLY